MKHKSLKNILIGASSLLAMWLVWVIAVFVVDNEYVVPTIKDTMVSLFDLFKKAFFWKSILRTLYKVILALAISFLVAGIFGTLGKTLKAFGKFLNPIITVIRTLPTMAVLVLILIYTTRTIAPIVVASLVLLPMIYAQFCTAYDTIDDKITNTAKAFGLTRKQKILKIYLPIVAPTIIKRTGSNMSFAIKLIISAEVMSNTFTSIGGMMQNASALMNVSELMALTLIAVLLGLLIEFIFDFACDRIFPWMKKEVSYD